MNASPRTRGFFAVWSVHILILFLVAMPVLAYSAVRAVGTNSNQIADWLPSNMAETRALRDFNKWFGDGTFVVVSWDGCRIDTEAAADSATGDDPRLQRLADALVPPVDSTSTDSPLVELPPDDSSVDNLTADLTSFRGVDPELQEIDRWAAEFDAAVGAPAVFSAKSADSANPVDADQSLDPQYFSKVVTSRSVLTMMTSPPLNIPRDEAVRRLRGNLIGPDGQACLVVYLSDLGAEHLREALGVWKPRWIDRHKPQGKLFCELEASGVPLADAHLGGPAIDNLSINEEGQRTLLRLAIAAGTLGLGLAWWSLKSIKLTVIVFTCGIISTCGATAAIWISGCHADAIVLAMPALIYVLTISGAIHLVNYYRDAIEHQDSPNPVGAMLSAGYKPATLCSVTTAIGLLSLFASDLTPIRRFGVFSATGMMLMLVVLFLFLPAAIHVVGGKSHFGLVRRRSAVLQSEQHESWIEYWAVRWARLTTRHYRWICIGGLVAMVLLSYGVRNTRTSVDLLKLFDSKTRILADYRWLEANLGNLVPLEVLVRFDRTMIGDANATVDQGTLTMLNRAQLVNRVRGHIEQEFGQPGANVISSPLAATAFLPELSSNYRGRTAVIQRRILDSRLNQCRETLLSSGYLTVDPRTGDELWRISLRVAAFKGVDFGRMAEQVRGSVNPYLHEISDQMQLRSSQVRIVPVSAIHTGAVPIVYKAQAALLESLIDSTMWSFLTITPLLMWVTRGVRSGLVAMIPNLLPVLAVFGSMGWLGISVDIGCMMTASIALGVAVDDTIHFLSWYRHAQQTTTTRPAAIEAAYRSCCRPTLQAALVNGLGLSVFLLSSFVPTKQFGLLMLVILTCGAVAELLLLPAILASPLGRTFAAPVTSVPLSARIPRCLATARSAVRFRSWLNTH
jgi:predicted RND superfamily exporter protein